MSRMPIVYSNRSRIEELSKNLYRIDLPMPEGIGQTNSYLFKADGITDSGRSLIVDAGCDEPETREAFDFALRELGVSWDSVDVFITHFHWDHCAGLSQIWSPGMKVYGGIDDYAERGVPVMCAAEIGALERRTSEVHRVGDTYDASYWEPMTRSGTVNPPITRLFEGEVLSVGGDQVLCTGYPPIMVETKADQLSLLLSQTERLGKLSASLVLTGHGKEGCDLSARCDQIIDHYRRQTDSFLALCQSGECDLGELSYQSTLGDRRTPWEARSIFGRRSLITQTMAFATYFTSKGMLRNEYDIIPLR